MEKTLSATTTLPFFSKTLRRTTAAAQIRRSQLPLRRITTTGNAVFPTSPEKFGSDTPLFVRRNAGALVPLVRFRLCCVSSSAASFGSAGGGGEVEENPIGGGVDGVSPSSSDVIVLDVRGMMCEGCSSSVKRILENQSQVSSASVDHTTDAAVVWPITEAKVTPNWQKVIGEELAKNLTNCGFNSNLRVNNLLQCTEI